MNKKTNPFIKLTHEKLIYGLRELCNHLIDTKQLDRVTQLLTNIFFLEEKILNGWVFELIDDYSNAIRAIPNPSPITLELLQESIRRDLHFIENNPTAFFQCMWNSCWWHDCPDLSKYFESESLAQKSLPQNDKEIKLHLLLEKWYEEKKEDGRVSPWLRSLRPPSTKLNSGISFVLQLHEGPVMDLSFSPNGKYLVSGSSDNSVRIWDSENGSQFMVLEKFRYGIRKVKFSPNGDFLLVGTSQGKIKIIDLQLQSEVFNVNHLSDIFDLTFSPDGKKVISVGNDYRIRIWDIQSEKEVLCYCGHGEKTHHAKRIKSIDVSPNGKLAVSSDNEFGENIIRVWEVETGKDILLIKCRSLGVDYVTFSPDGKKIAASLKSADKDIVVWDLSGNELIAIKGGTQKQPGYLDFSPDSETILCAVEDKLLSLGVSTIVWWDLNKKEVLGSFDWHSKIINCVLFSPDGKKVASASDDGTIVLADLKKELDLKDQSRAYKIKNHSSKITDIACSPNGRWFVTSSWDRTVRKWDAFSGIELKQFTGLKNVFRSVAIYPNSLIIAAGGSYPLDDEVILWDSRSGEEVKRFKGHSNSVLGLTFTQDGRFLLCDVYLAQGLYVWDLHTSRFHGYTHGAISNYKEKTRSPFKIRTKEGETIVVNKTTGEYIARIPIPLDKFILHPSRKIIAGSDNNRFNLFELCDFI